MTIPQIVADLCARVNDLEGTRKERFLDWLNKHHGASQPPTSETLPIFLNTWLGSLSAQGMQWEVQLLLDEITWWRNLSAARLWCMLEAEHSI
jgi:hypothetical protein